MEVKELMIGDFIRIKGKPYKVSYIAPFDIGDARLAVISNDYDGNPYLSGIEPIPLTPEILEANGFEINENVRGYQYPNDEKICCLEELCGVFIWNGGYNDIIIEYVHELQHILRICGLNELADNLKIE